MKKRSDFLVVTLVIGDEIEALARYTVPSIRQYAEKIGADFKVLEKTDISEKLSQFYEKNQIRDYLEHYSKVLYIDADILVSPDAPNAFTQYPGDNIGVVSVEQVYKAAEKEKQTLIKELGDVAWTKEYFNTGVVLFSAAHKQVVNTDDGLIEKWIEAKSQRNVAGLNDQSVFNFRMNQWDVPLTYMDNAFNFTKAWGCFEKRFSKYFIHYAGMRGNRITRIKVDDYVLQNSFLYSVLKASPLLTKLFDAVVLRVMK